MAALAGIMNQHAATGQSVASLSSATPMTGSASTTSSSKSSSSSSATITANDFLTLLVTEMKNQDPTTQSDPNAYINQLVQVNSLEQLIDVNQNLVTGLKITSTTSDASQSSTTDAVNSSVANATAQTHSAAQKGASSALPSTGLSTASSTATTAAAAANQVSGNLSVPQATTASQRVAHSLGRHSVSQ